MARTPKQPIIGTVRYVSKRGTEVHIEGDTRRYRGVKTYLTDDERCMTKAVFSLVKPGDIIVMHWGGFANLNIRHVRFAYWNEEAREVKERDQMRRITRLQKYAAGACCDTCRKLVAEYRAETGA